MNATIKLLTTVAITNIACRSVHVVISHQEQKIFHMTELPWKHLLLRNLRKSPSIHEALFSTYCNLLESMADSETQQEFNKSIMEPFVDSIYTTTSTSGTWEMPCNLPTSSVVGCENDGSTITNSLDINLSRNNQKECSNSYENRYMSNKQKYKAMRKWKKIGEEKSVIDKEDTFILRVLSYNILAQNLLDSHRYLYKDHDRRALPWEIRKPLLLQEILEAQANVICLQEMQEQHLAEFLIPFKEREYKYLYKKRTNDKKDGLLFLYRSDLFNLVDYAKVELFQSKTEVLNRDNVGIIAKLSLKDSPQTQIVVATTHLLYNPNRNDVRLAQVQLLLAEIERFAFIENESEGSKYLPIILSGDFNLKPHTGVYKFITTSSFEYVGKGRNLEPSGFRPLSNSLIPINLCITDNCQHFDILTSRIKGGSKGLVMLLNSEHRDTQKNRDKCRKKLQKYDIDVNTSKSAYVKISDDHHVTFSSVNTEANARRIAMVENCFGSSGEPLAVPGRVLVGEGVLTKMCRKRPKPRQFFLFNDILVYGNIMINKKKYNKQRIIPLEEVKLESLADDGQYRNGWLIKTVTKSFAVYAATTTEKQEWMAHITKSVEDLLRKSGKKPVEVHAAVWVPDNEATICMHCNKTQFTVLNRRHHCRQCGAVVCGPCSNKKLILATPRSRKAVRVCLQCYDAANKITASSPTVNVNLHNKDPRNSADSSGGDSSGDEDDANKEEKHDEPKFYSTLGQ
ncbi:uncharacterized protein [Prorops nasuta]|uniref:uncharacterized protein n=1 Tax=Prorops nasuta TaxID=863751 RepID=UPI0034CF1F4E